MATKQQLVKVCDVCKKRVTSNIPPFFIGAHPHEGWYEIQKLGLNHVDKRHERVSWDVCSSKCLSKLSVKLDQ